jgi:hypothetical protein
MMLLDILSTFFLTHVGNLTTVKSNQRCFAPTPAHITGIRTKGYNAVTTVFAIGRSKTSEHQSEPRFSILIKAQLESCCSNP